MERRVTPETGPHRSTTVGLPLDRLTRSVMDTSAMAVLIINQQGQIVDANDEATRRLQYNRDELLQLFVADINPDLQSINEFRERYLPLVMAGETVSLAMNHQCKDGTAFPVQIDAHRIEVDGDHYVCSFVRDVRRSNLATLRLVNERLRSTIYIYDLVERRNLYVNQSIAIELGYSVEEIVERGDRLLAELIHPDDIGKIESHHRAAVSMSENESRDVEYRMRHRHGHYVRMHSRDAVYKRDENGDVVQIVGVAMVLDEIEALRQSTEQLQAANEELKHFAYVASHDLKQPLRGISHLAQWIEEDAGGSLAETSREYLTKLQGRIGRMQRLLDDMLMYSRVGRVNLAVSDFDLAEVVTEVVDLLPRPRSFAVVRHGLDVPMTGHRLPLAQVLQNLIGNAIKHRVADDGQVRIEAEIINQRVHIAVVDDGEGIPEKFRKRVFEMFQTLKSGDSNSTGIGLTISRKQVKQYGGDLLLVDDDRTSGCRFVFDWPLVIAGRHDATDPDESLPMVPG